MAMGRVKGKNMELMQMVVKQVMAVQVGVEKMVTQQVLV